MSIPDRPRVAIQYCTQCRWLLRAAWMAQELLTTFEQDHGDIKSIGYRIGDVAYSSDVVGLPEASFEILEGVRVWIVDALRYRPHPTHATVEQALAWIDRVKPERAILTNLHVDLDYETLKRELPDGVEPAYNGLSFTCDG